MHAREFDTRPHTNMFERPEMSIAHLDPLAIDIPNEPVIWPDLR